jgi:hypothetical protein
MKPTPILEELKIAAEAASFHCNDPADAIQVQNGLDLLDEDVVPGINDAIKRHEKLEALLSEIYLWCEGDAAFEDWTPPQAMLDERVKVLKRAMKLVRK